VRSGLPDVEVIQQQLGEKLIVFVELKSRRSVASKAQKPARAEMLPAGAATGAAAIADDRALVSVGRPCPSEKLGHLVMVGSFSGWPTTNPAAGCA
jgi:hypothetical protein